jgi:hypothetical protein
MVGRLSLTQQMWCSNPTRGTMKLYYTNTCTRLHTETIVNDVEDGECFDFLDLSAGEHFYQARYKRVDGSLNVIGFGSYGMCIHPEYFTHHQYIKNWSRPVIILEPNETLLH